MSGQTANASDGRDTTHRDGVLGNIPVLGKPLERALRGSRSAHPTEASRAPEDEPGVHGPPRDAMGYGLAALNRIASLPVIDRFGLRKPLERATFQATKAGFQTVGAASRSFHAAGSLLGSGSASPARLAGGSGGGKFDLTLDEDQELIQQTVQEFAVEQLRPAAADADEDCQASAQLLERAGELGVTLLGIPEEIGGVGTQRSAMTNVLIAEAMAHGDMGLAVSCLAPSAVSNALVLWGDAGQQESYLAPFLGENPPVAALTLSEPRPLFDPFALATTARRRGEGFVLHGVKSMVPRAAAAELFVVAANLEGEGPALFLVESGSTGVSIAAEPAMGLRAASMGRLQLDDVAVSGSALLGAGRPEAYAECVRLSRLGWSALALGTGKAVLDYVIPYANERTAFGEPISHRQSVAFMVADIGIELEGMRMVTYRAASRADHGHGFARQAGLARAACAKHGMSIGTSGVQILGGHGYVKEHPVERWYRDLRSIGVMEGTIVV